MGWGRSAGLPLQRSRLVFRRPEPEAKAIRVQKVGTPAAGRLAHRRDDGDALRDKARHDIVDTAIGKLEDQGRRVAALALHLEEDDAEALVELALQPERL